MHILLRVGQNLTSGKPLYACHDTATIKAHNIRFTDTLL
jgi:glycerol uptake facilitator-like aquaporin